MNEWCVTAYEQLQMHKWSLKHAAVFGKKKMNKIVKLFAA